jgi:hypothetical protein
MSSQRLAALERRRRTHQGRLSSARRDQAARFWIAAGWLVVEARQAGRLTEVIGWMLARVEEYRAQQAAALRSGAPIRQFRARLDEGTDRSLGGGRRAG